MLLLISTGGVEVFLRCCHKAVSYGTEPFRSRANSLPGANRPIVPWPIRSLELSFPGAFAPLMCHRRVLSLSYTYEQNSKQCLSVLQK